MSTAPWQVVNSTEEALRRARVIWGALLLGQVAFACVIGVLFSTRPTRHDLEELSLALTRMGSVCSWSSFPWRTS